MTMNALERVAALIVLIEDERRERGLSVPETAELLGIARPTLYRWRDEGRLPAVLGPFELLRLSAFLGMSLDEIAVMWDAELEADFE